MKDRLQVLLSEETHAEIRVLVDKYEVSESSILAMLVRLGLDIFKAAISEEYTQMLKMLEKPEYKVHHQVKKVENESEKS